MGLLARWERPPARFRALLTGQERVLAMGDAGDRVLLATQQGLWLPDESDAGWRLLRWDRVVKATWQDDAVELVEGDLGADGIVTDLEPVHFRLTTPRNLPQVVRTRVETSIARTEQVSVPGGTARLVARRVPGIDGVTWTARLDTGTAATEAAVLVLREQLQRMVDAGQV